MKTDTDKDQVNNNNLLKMSQCFFYAVYINKIHLDVFNKVEVIKQYRQSVMKSENVDFCGFVIQNIQRLKIMTIVTVCVNIPKFCYGS